MKKSYLLPLLFLTALLLTNCGGKETQSDGAHKDLPAPISEDSVEKIIEMYSKARFTIEDKGEDEYGIPRRNVFLNVKINKMLIDSVRSECNPIGKEEFERYEIPADAIDACGGWWAGAGDYFYVVKKDGEYHIYRGWQDEQQTDEGYHWQLFGRTKETEVTFVVPSGR
jgi:hypothetical protein